MSDISCRRAFGLNIASDLPLPELPAGVCPPDLYIRAGPVLLPELEPTTIWRHGVEAMFGGTPQGAFIHWPGVVSMLAEQGRTLTVASRRADLPSGLLNQFLLSEALGIILFQRGSFLLHASAVAMDGRGIVLAGLPGVGKSTTAAGLLHRGHTVFSDDMVALDVPASGPALIQPGFDNVKLWPPSVAALGYAPEALPEIFPSSAKRLLRRPNALAPAPLPLRSIYILEAGEQLSLEKLTGMQTFVALLRFFPCPSALLQTDASDYLQKCRSLCERVPVVRVRVPRDLDRLGELLDGLERWPAPLPAS